jgi:hypothetical protein
VVCVTLSLMGDDRESSGNGHCCWRVGYGWGASGEAGQGMMEEDRYCRRALGRRSVVSSVGVGGTRRYHTV